MMMKGVILPEVEITAVYGGIVSGHVLRPEIPLEVFLVFNRTLRPSVKEAVHLATEPGNFCICNLADKPYRVCNLVVPVLNRNELGCDLLLPPKTEVQVTLGPVIEAGLLLFACDEVQVRAIRPLRLDLHTLHLRHRSVGNA
jgi:hypothetical protein